MKAVNQMATMKKKKYKNPIPALRKKADKLYQQVGMMRYGWCEICGKTADCIHHYFPKSIASVLRYDIDNAIPICISCHLNIHKKNDPSMNAGILSRRGLDWHNDLSRKRSATIKTNVSYYRSIIEDLEEQLLILENQ